MRGHRWMLPMVFLMAGAGTLLAQAPDSSALVRLSFVQGQVSIVQGATTQFDRAQANMPLFAGNTIATGENGQAEIEFTDGSVARLTPQSRLRLDRLPNDARSGVTELEMLTGLGYFELNTADGQRYVVHFNAAVAQPAENSIFRIDLDDAPDLSVFAGSVHASSGGAFDERVSEGRSLRFPADDVASVSDASSIPNNSWDRWNQDRDDQIAREAQQQTSARATSGASNEPGWDDLDYYGDWYPVEDYGNVWVPSDVPAGWDPFSSGYWANYPGWGYTWISSYSWGWLPYHCGAWNYWNSFGWGWVPGQCGLGWQPVTTVWNAPAGFRPPPRPIPGGHAGPATTLLAVNRGPALPQGGVHNSHTQPIRLAGQRLDPLPVMQDPTLGGRFSYRGTNGVAAPVGRSYGFSGNGGVRILAPGTVARPGTLNGAPASPIATPRPVYRVPSPGPVYRAPTQGTQEPRSAAPSPQPRVYSPPSTPAPRPVAPAPRMEAPAPRMSAPPPSAPHVSAPPQSAPSGHH